MRLACCALAICLLFIFGCPSLTLPDDASEQFPSGNPTPPNESPLSIEDGTYRGPVTEEIALILSSGEVETSATNELYYIVTVESGRFTSLRIGSKPVGKFVSLGILPAERYDVGQALGSLSVLRSRDVVSSSSNVLYFTVDCRINQDNDVSQATGEGFLALKVVGQDLSLKLNEQVTYNSGPLAGYQQKTRERGILTKTEGTPKLVELSDTADEVPTEVQVQVLPPEGQDFEYEVEGMEDTPEGPSQYIGTRTVVLLDSTITSPDGMELNILVETFDRQIPLADGGTGLETTVARIYFAYDDEGKARIYGFQEEGTDRFMVDPSEGVSGGFEVLEVGATRQYTATYTGGMVETFEETVTGTAEVLFPYGAFEVFVSEVRTERTWQDGREDKLYITKSIHPVFGLLQRKVSGTVSKSDGTTSSLQYEELFLIPGSGLP